jgi:hypothetical protein
MNINKVSALKTGDKIVLDFCSHNLSYDTIYTVTGTHQTSLHELKVYVKNELDKYELELPMLAGDKVRVLSYS